MVKLGIEIIDIVSFEDIIASERVDKDDLLKENLDMLHGVLIRQDKRFATTTFQLVCSKAWNKLPQTLYRVIDDDNENPYICRKVRKERPVSTSKVYEIYLFHRSEEILPKVIVNVVE